MRELKASEKRIMKKVGKGITTFTRSTWRYGESKFARKSGSRDIGIVDYNAVKRLVGLGLLVLVKEEKSVTQYDDIIWSHDVTLEVELPC